MKELIKITNHDTLTNSVLARDLHKTLEIGKDYSNWIKAQIVRADLTQDVDFIVFAQKGENDRNMIEHALTLDSAKNIAMLSQTEKGKEVRAYFIECENKLKGVIPVIHDPVIAALVNTLQQLDIVKQEQSVQSLRIEALEAKQDAIINGSDYFAVSAYANLVKIPVDNKLASSIGKEATTYCSVNNINLGEATHPLWGTVHTYPKYVLEIIFNRMA